MVVITSGAGAGVMIDKSIPKPTPTQYPFYDPTPFPSPTSKPTPVNTPITSQVKGAQITKSNIVDCVGPDGIHMMDKTQEECDAFNSAWNKPKPTQASQQNYTVPSSGSSNSYTSEPLVNCTVSFTCTGNISTYRTTAAMCAGYQNSAAAICNFKGSGATYEPIKAPTIKVDPWPTLGASVPIQNNCETYTNNGGSTTVCK